METLIGIFSAVFNFFTSIGAFFGDLSKSFHGFWSVETMFLGILISVSISGMAAFGPWIRKRKPGEFPWQ